MKRAVVGLMVAIAALAQAPPPGNAPVPGNLPPLGPPQSDSQGVAPDHGVARISVIEGSVSIRQGDAGDLSAAALNAPLMATDRISTGDGSRAEVEFDALNSIRLAPNTEVRLSELQYKQYQVQIAQGTVMFHVVRDNDAREEISTPTVLVRPAKQGSYRLTVNPDGTTQIDVRMGQVEVFGPGGSEFVNAGQTMMARGSPSDPQVQVIQSGPQDDFDRWNADRDRIVDRNSSTRYVSPDVSGAESLDPYGQWHNDPQYGNVWVPSESPGWAPYQDGRWAYTPYYGWTWLGVEPWAWAPYHYGYWYSSSWGWAWWPGPIGVPYFWRPAMVGFFGWGGGGFGFGFGFGFGYGNVGWVALAPREVFHPWYGAGAGVFSRTSIVNNVNIANTYRNARFTNAIGGVRAAEFGRGAVSARSMVRATPADLTRAGSVRGAMPFAPTQASRQFSNATVSTRGMPQARPNLNFSTAGSRIAPQANRGAPGAGFANPGAAPSNRSFAPSPQTQGTARPSVGNNGGWRSFDPSGGARGNVGQASPRAYSAPQQPAPQVRGYSAPQYSGPQSRGYSAPQYSSPGPRYSAPQAGPRYSGPPAMPQAPRAPGGGGFSAPQRLQINPPIVRDRGPSGGGGGAPRMAAPRSGGGGGGNHGGGGGHGGGRR